MCKHTANANANVYKKKLPSFLEEMIVEYVSISQMHLQMDIIKIIPPPLQQMNTESVSICQMQLQIIINKINTTALATNEW